MASNAGVTLDKVIIEIESNAEKANSNISALTETLSALKNAIKGGFNNLNKLSEGLKQLNEASAKLPQTAQNLSSIQQVTEVLKGLSSIDKPIGLKHVVENLSKIPEVFGKFDTSALDNVKRVSEQLSSAITPLANKLGAVGQGYSALNQMADRYGVSVTKVREYTKQTTDRFGALKRILSSIGSSFNKSRAAATEFGKNAIRQFGSLNSKIKQVALSLLGTRSLFTAVRKAISEYMQMDAELTKTTTNLWRALGAQLAPAVEYVIYLFTQITRVIYSVVKALTGIDLIARANAKAMAGWGKSAKDTLASLQKFDDLNVADFGKDAGDNNLIELDEIDLSPIQKILDLVRKIKEEIKSAFDTGQWSGVGKAVADLYNYAFAKVKTADIKKALRKFTKPVTDTLNGIVQNLNWSDFGAAISNVYTSIVSAVGDLINNFDFGSFGSGLVDAFLGFNSSNVLETWLYVFESVNNGINSFVASINSRWADLKKEATEIATVIGKMFNEMVFGINWAEIMKAVTEGINTLISGALTFIETFDWSGFGEVIGDVVNSFFENFNFGKLADSLSKLLSGLLNALSSFVSTVDWSKVGDSIVRLIIDVDWAQLSVDLLQFVQDLWTSILTVTSQIGASLGEWIWSLFGGESDATKEARTFGERINDGLMWGAIEGSRPKNKDAISKALGTLKGFIKGFFGIHSPSTWARDEIGENIALGFANGLSGLWSKSKQHFVAFVNGVIELINSMIRSINNKLKISIGSTISSILKGLGVKVNSGTYQLFSIPTIPKLETGTNEIPYEGLYHLHPGEAVVPKKYNPALGSGSSEETNQKLDTLIYLMENMNFTNIINIGNKTLYKEQQRYNNAQNDKYGTTVNL